MARTIAEGLGRCKVARADGQSRPEDHTVPATTNRRVLLRNRPVGEPRPTDFEIVDAPLPAPADGESLCRTIWLSLDPYMRGRMSDRKSYTASVEIGQPMVGGTVSEVVQSRHPGFAAGDVVLGYGGWQTHHVARAGAAPGPFGPLKLDPAVAPVSTALGVLGMPGMTAYVGLLDLGQPQAGQTVVVSAAAGAVGSIVGQLARIRGCRAVGVAGAQSKCDYVVKELGFDACVSYRSPDLLAALRDACPQGIDVYFDNVAGAVLDAVLKLLNPFARIPLCGLVSQYNATELPPGPNWAPLLFNRVTVRGFIVSDHVDRLPAFLADMAGWVRQGRIKYREDVVEGLDQAPRAFIGLLRGENLGKLLVKVGPDPTRA
jgi:NADPH-dependent curcumin reductase CurA